MDERFLANIERDGVILRGESREKYAKLQNAVLRLREALAEYAAAPTPAAALQKLPAGLLYGRPIVSGQEIASAPMAYSPHAPRADCTALHSVKKYAPVPLRHFSASKRIVFRL